MSINYADGYRAGYQDGYKAGHSDGINAGFSDAKERAFSIVSRDLGLSTQGKKIVLDAIESVLGKRLQS